MTESYLANAIKTILLAALLTIFLTKPAYAYLDPVSMTFILQAIAGAIAAVLASIKSVRAKIWNAVTAIFGRRNRSDDE